MRLHLRHLGHAAVLALSGLSIEAAAEEELVERGSVLFHECAACHMVGDGAVHAAGPHLNGVIGRRIGSIEGFTFSERLARDGGVGEVWDVATLDGFLHRPQETKPGTWMYFDGLEEEEDRLAVIAFLVTHADDVSAEGGSDPRVDAILAIEPDLAYGAYLSSECTACHAASGSDIPAINGLSRATFTAGLLGYRDGTRQHQVMSMLASRLGDEEIAALAAYFEDSE